MLKIVLLPLILATRHHHHHHHPLILIYMGSIQCTSSAFFDNHARLQSIHRLAKSSPSLLPSSYRFKICFSRPSTLFLNKCPNHRNLLSFAFSAIDATLAST
jgi:hypothetical protein